jgi:hypothetical protein
LSREIIGFAWRRGKGRIHSEGAKNAKLRIHRGGNSDQQLKQHDEKWAADITCVRTGHATESAIALRMPVRAWAGILTRPTQFYSASTLHTF